MAHAGHICSVCSSNQIEDIQRALDAGVRLADIANQYGLGRSSLYRHIEAGHWRKRSDTVADREQNQADNRTTQETYRETSREDISREISQDTSRDTSPIAEPIAEATNRATTEQTPEPAPELTMTSLPGTTQQLLQQQRERLAEQEAAAAAVDPERPVWRNNPIFTPEWGDQLRRHLGLMQWPKIEIAGTIEGGSEQAWQAYFDALLRGGFNTATRQVTERRIRFAEAVLHAEQDGIAAPPDPDTPTVTVMYASPERIPGLGE